MADRRRINGPAGGTTAPIYASSPTNPSSPPTKRPSRTRLPNELRKIFLKTGLTPSASGSAYLELSPSPPPTNQQPTLTPPSSALKLTCTVHGPRPLPRSAPFTPHILLSTHVKFAPFATRLRRGYLRDASERDLAVHLETALRGVIIGDRWPKSGVEVVITVLEGEEDAWCGGDEGSSNGGVGGGWGMMNVLAGCITVASAAIADAGIDCVDLVSGGVAAIVGTSPPRQQQSRKDHHHHSPRVKQGQHLSSASQYILDPCPSEHENLQAACVVAHLPFRDEITALWFKGDLPPSSTTTEKPSKPETMTIDHLIDQAVEAASGARTVLEEATREAAEHKLQKNEVDKRQADANGKGEDTSSSSDVDMGS